MNLGRISVCGVVLIAAGCGTTTRYVTQTQTITQTQTVTRTVVKHAAAPQARTVTVTDTTTARAAQTAGGSGPYQGNGTSTVGTITVNSPSTIQWTCQGCAAFALVSDVGAGGSAIDIGSRSQSGTSALYPGTYTNVRVVSDGNWAFQITPG